MRVLSKLKRLMWSALLVACVMVPLGVMAQDAEGAEATVAADFASAYVFRGATFNDGAVFQPYVDVAGLPIEFGIWGNLDIDDYDDSLDDGQFSEIDIYASYALPLGIDPVGVSVGYTEYVYPNADAEADREIGLSVGLDALLSPELGLYYGIDGGIDESLHAELAVSQTIVENDTVTVELGASVAFEDPDAGEDGFSYYTASLGASYGILSAGVTYVGQIDDDVLVDVEDGGVYDTDVYGTIGISYSF